jgi:hypothetical protein
MPGLDPLKSLAGQCLAALEGPLWLVCLATVSPIILRAVRRIRAAGQGRELAAVLALAIALRFAVPWEPIFWHYPLMNVDAGKELYTRYNSYLPWVLRLLVFDLHGGFDAALAFNLVTGVACIPLLWYAALAGGHSPRASALFALLLAVTPMYVRHSGSDSVYVAILFLYAAAAAAYARLAVGEGGTGAAALLVSSVLIGMPIRGESAPVFLGVPLFFLRGDFDLRTVLRPRRPLILLGAAVVFGLLATSALQSQSYGERLHLHADTILLGVVVQVLCLPAPAFPSFFPPLIAVPIWIVSIDLIRRRHWRELASIHLPIWVGRLPHLFGAAFMSGGLATTGYHIISVVFILLASARCTDYLYLRYRRGEFLADPRRRRIALSAAALAGLFWCVQAYGYRCIEGQEMRFLSRELPRDESTIAVIWDPDPSPGDDCCLSLPYPPLWAEMPRTRWIVLTLADLDRPEYVRDLHFDYYYPGSTLQLVDSSTWFTRRWGDASDQERLRLQRAGLERWRELDALVRREHAIEPWRSTTVTGHTPSFAHFKDDTVTFQIYRSATRR